MGRDLNGKRAIKHVYGATHREVLREMKCVSARTLNGAFVATTTPTLARFLQEWFKSHEADWRPSTRRSYKGAIDLYLVPTFGSVRLEKLTPIRLQRWIDDHRAEHGARRRVALAHAVLRSALGEAQRLQLLPSNPAALVKLPKLNMRAVTPLSAEEATRLIATAQKHRLGALFTVTLACGLRLGKALGLTWNDVNLETGEISVNQQLQYVGKQAQLQPLKTQKSRRKLMLPQVAIAPLRAHRLAQNEQRMEKGADFAGLGLVFATYARAGDGRKLGTPLHPRNVTRVFAAILKKAGIKHIRFHDLRHSAASLLISQGVELVAVSQLLGHSELRVTADLYTHLQKQTAAQAARHMDNLLSGQQR